MSVSIIGTYHSKVGKLEDKSLYDLLVEAGRGALEDAAVTGKDIDAVFVGNFAGGQFNKQEHIAPYTIEIDRDLRFKPCVRVENACASGSTAVAQAVNAIEAGKAETVLVIGVEKMTSLKTSGVTGVLVTASHYPLEGEKGYTFPGLYAEFAKGYMTKYRHTVEGLYDTMGLISCKAHKNAMSNPLAHMHVEYSHEFTSTITEKNPLIAEPLKLTDCSLVSDGAASIVITKTERAKLLKDKVVEISEIVHVSDYLSIVEGKRSNYELTAAKHAVKKALENTGLTIDDIDVAEVHDCFTITELLIYEALGLASEGRGREVLLNGDVYHGGKLPINLSGGLKAKGHPVGASGVSMHVLIARQLLGEAVGLQAEGAETGLTLNIGGSGATNIVSILRRVR